MPLSKEGKKIMSNMKKTYKDPKKAKQVFYAMENSWKLPKKAIKESRKSRMK